VVCIVSVVGCVCLCVSKCDVYWVCIVSMVVRVFVQALRAQIGVKGFGEVEMSILMVREWHICVYVYVDVVVCVNGWCAFA